MKYSFVGLWVRTLAFSLDYILIAIYLIAIVIIGVALNFTYPTATRTLFANPVSSQITGFLTITLPITFYFALFESSSWQATWGKRKIGLRVIRTDGAPMSRARALGRSALKFIPWELAHTCIWQISFHPQNASTIIYVGFMVVWVLVGLNILSLLVSKSHQTLYDWLAHSYVVKT